MSDWVHEHLEDSKKAYDAIPIPSHLQSAVNLGIQRAVSARKLRLRLFAVSPAFASYVSQIPGMDRIVQLISNDKGLQLAIDHNLLQPINVTDSHDGMSLTVDNVIMDEARLVLFYTLKGPMAASNSLDDIRLLDENGEQLHVSFGINTMHQVGDDKDRSSFIDVMIPENTPTFKHITLSFGSRLEADSKKWQVSFNLNPDKAHNPKKIINFNKSIPIGGQIIHIDKATIYPTRLLLDVSFDEMNSQQIFQLLDLKLIDNKGREWKKGSFSINNSDNHRSINFESMYFAEPKSLTLHGTGISALDKADLDVMIDPKSGALLKAPLGLSFMGSSMMGKDLRVNFQVVTSSEGESNLSFGGMTDGEGDAYQLGNGGWSTGKKVSDSWNDITNAAHAPGPLTLRINSYPLEIKEAFEAEIPLR